MPDNFNYPPGSDADPRAPWHEEEKICAECGGNRFEKTDTEFAGERCLNCPVEECPNCDSTNLDQERATCRNCLEEWER